MRVTIFCGHPEIENSASHQFLKTSVPKAVDYIAIERSPTAEQIQDYQQQFLASDRVFLEFPLYWYQAPGMISEWCEAVFDETFTRQLRQMDAAKDFGVIISVGQPEAAYRAGGREGFSLSEILKPFEAIAHHFHFNYVAPFVLSQYMYMTDEARREKLVAFHQHLLLDRQPSFQQKATQILDHIDALDDEVLGDQAMIASAFTTAMQDQLEHLDDLREEIKWQEAGE